MSKASKRERQRVNREARRQAEITAARRRRTLKAVRNGAIVLVPLLAVILFFQLRSGGNSSSTITRHYSKAPTGTLARNKTYTATIDTSMGKIVMTLDAAAAPKSAYNFVFLARHRFYDGLTFHRVAKDFVIQGGDPKGDGSGGPGYSLTAEGPRSGYQVGSVAWAKAGNDPAGTAGSQFFIVTSPAAAPGQGLDVLNQQPYQYGMIGTVTQGLDVAQKIGLLAPANGDGKPTKKVTIKKVTIHEATPTSSTAPASSAPPSS